MKKLSKIKRILNRGIKHIKNINKSAMSMSEDAGPLDICRKCFSFRYENEWHLEKPEYLMEKDVDEKVFVRFSQCPSCVEETLAMYDAEYA